MQRAYENKPIVNNRRSAGMTPFRYPGGKAFLADLLQERIAQTNGKVHTYAEPYAGGAGAAVELLAREVIDKIVLNDFDRRIFSAWSAIVNDSEKFIARIVDTKVNIETWHHAREIVEANRKEEDPFELGFATFFLNRTNHSGVIIGAGPIGGYNQTGKWLIDARWYSETICRRIEWIGNHRSKIELFNKDGLHFLSSFSGVELSNTFFFIDPPYVQAGAKLYMNAMNDLKHIDLAKYLTGDNPPEHWLVTYDDCRLISDAYSSAAVGHIPVRYSLRKKRMEHEVCIVPI